MTETLETLFAIWIVMQVVGISMGLLMVLAMVVYVVYLAIRGK